MEPFIGQIMQVGFSYAPYNWMVCDGTTIQIAQNNALYALLGTTFGGNGTSNFLLPDARGRAFLGAGNGPGLTPRPAGAKAGLEQTNLTPAQLPTHTHTATYQTVSNPTFSGTLTAIGGFTYSDESPDPQTGCYLGSVSEADTTPAFYVPANKASQPNAQRVAMAGLSGVVSGGAGAVVVNPAGQSAAVPLMPPFLAVTTIIAVQGIWPSRE